MEFFSVIKALKFDRTFLSLNVKAYTKHSAKVPTFFQKFYILF